MTNETTKKPEQEKMTDEKTLDGLLEERVANETTMNKINNLIDKAAKKIIIEFLKAEPRSYAAIYSTIKHENNKFRSADIRNAIDSLLFVDQIRPYDGEHYEMYKLMY